MEQNQKIERMKALIETLNAAAKAYYQESRELMPNHEYDALYRMRRSFPMRNTTRCTMNWQHSKQKPA